MKSASHLFRRAGFGATLPQLEEATRRTPAEVVSGLLDTQEPDSFLQQMNSLAQSAIATGNVQQLSAVWAYRMLFTPAQLQEKATAFCHRG